ncbi:type I polyketide synthase [Spirillospora sp. CA-294931]|uniref:type I polyketide synthase n=1 Tax=Spirillospora sp. CA-294931 TaxID=3240042 RepID=UPI003D935DAF
MNEQSAAENRGRWRARLMELPDAARHAALMGLIAEQVGAVLGAGRTVEPDLPWRRLGVVRDGARRCRERLADATGLELPATLFFDHPTPAAVAGYLRSRLLGIASEAARPEREGPEAEPIAIVGMACRLPGDVDSPDDLWRLVLEERDVIGGFPADRGWDLPALYHPDPEHRGTTYARGGGFLRDPGLFDPGFFGIGPREATAMDPQQRLMLETAWEALERAGIDPGTLRGSRTGVFTGVSIQDYGPSWHRAPDEAQGRMFTGTMLGVVSGRVAYTLGLEGPAMTVDTACSASLVALHLAARSLRDGESDLALAGGATVMSTPGMLLEFSRKGGLSPDGRCRAFSAAADGTGWSEGAAMLLLERLPDARRNGHPVLALLRASAVNQDGASNGLTAPSGRAQQRMIRQALANGGLAAADVDAVEAHGTGTPLGDPIEATALLHTYGRDRPADRTLWIGSLKSNLGHTQAAAGAAGVIKMVQAMRHRLLPKTLHAEDPTPHVDWRAGNLAPLTEPRPWDRPGRPRRAAVSAFGVSGTNAHVILEEPPEPPALAARERPSTAVAWVVSGRTEDALRDQAARLLEHAEARPELDLVDAAFSLAGRTRFEHRAAVVGSGRDELSRGLAAIVRGASAPGVLRGSARPTGKVAFLFTGQGSQRAGMGRRLHAAFPVFAEALDEICAEFDDRLPRPLREVMFNDPEALHQTGYAQPALFAFEVALFRLVQSWGLAPDVVLGHSIGEFAAAYVAGLWSLGDACTLVAARGRLMQACPATGAMIAIAAAEDEVLAERRHPFDIAAVNGSRSTVISGDRDAVAAAAALWEQRGRATIRLNTGRAFHSAHMDGMLAEFREIAAGVTARAPVLPVISTLTGEHADLCSPEHWTRHAREPVRFLDALRRLRREGPAALVELGPAPTLTAMSADCLPDGPPAVAAQRGGPAEDQELLEALAELHVRGVPIAWHDLYAERGARPAELPTYAFQRRRYWLDEPEPPSSAKVPAAWLHRIGWTRAHGIPAQGPVLSGRWLLVTPTTGVAPELLAQVAGALEQRGAVVDVLPLCADDADRARLARRLGPGEGLAGVLSLLALDQTVHARHSSMTDGLALTCALIQAMTDRGVTAPLWCATESAVSAGASDRLRNPRQAMVWGLGRTVALELPRHWGGLIDLPADPSRRAVDWLAAVLAAPDGEDQLAIRDSGPLARRLVPAQNRTGTPWRPRGTVLVTGGTGALGTHTARWLARNGAQHIVLTSRRGPRAPGADALLAELRALGRRASILACDVADRDSVAAMLDALPGDLTAVVHAAGVIDRIAPLIDIDLAEFAGTIAGKVLGADHLTTLLDGVPLDAVVLFSSTSAAWGVGGAAAYAAGNTYLDALACRLRSGGVAATAIEWGPWADGGMVTDLSWDDDLRERGLTPMAPATAITALAHAGTTAEPVFTVVDLEPARFTPVITAFRPNRLFDELTASPAQAQPPAALDHLRSLDESERARTLLPLIRAEIAALLGHASGEEIDPHRRFLELGFDSLASVTLRRRLIALTGLNLPSAAVLDHPTAEGLATHLAASLSVTDEPHDSLSVRHLYRHACEIDKLDEGIGVLQALAKLRPDFGDRAEFRRPVPVTRLTTGSAPHTLVCLPSIFAPCDYNFSRLGRNLDGQADVHTLRYPGFGDGDPLPRTLEVVLDVLSDTLLRHFRDTRFVLAGYSSGGWLAHALTHRLEHLGTAPAALALLDTPHPRSDPADFRMDLRALPADDAVFALMTDAELLAQGTYIHLLENWTPSPLTTPLTFAQASESTFTALWNPTTTLDLPGDHRSMLNEHVDITAKTLVHWLGSL